MAIVDRVGSFTRMESMSWDGTIYLNGDGGISSNGALLGCATGTGAPIAPPGYRFFSAWGYVGGERGSATTDISNSVFPGAWLPLVAEEGYQFPSSYSSVSGKWKDHGGNGYVNGNIFNPYMAKEFFLSGNARASIKSRFTSTSDKHSAGATLQMRVMTAGPYEYMKYQSARPVFAVGWASKYLNNGYTVGDNVDGVFTSHLASTVPPSAEYPTVPIAIGVNSVSHTNSGDFTGYNGYSVVGGHSWEYHGEVYRSFWWSASGFAPLSAY